MRVYFGTDGGPGVGQFIKPMAVFYVTHNGGMTWKYTTSMPLKPISSYADIGFQPSDFADINNGWLADHNTLYATANSGRQWTVRTTSFPLANQLNFVSSQVGWALRKVEFTTRPEPSFFKTADGGRTWTPLTYTISRP